MNHKHENKRAVEHIMDVVQTMEIEGNADHDAVMFINVSRDRKGTHYAEGESEEIELNSFVIGCPCTVIAGIATLMENDKNVAIAICEAVDKWKQKHDPLTMLAKVVSNKFKEHLQSEEKAKQTSRDASKN